MDWEKIMPIAIPLLISAGTFALSVLDVRRKGESGMIANYFQLYTAMVGERNKAVEERDKYKLSYDEACLKLEACQEELANNLLIEHRKTMLAEEELRNALAQIAELESQKEGGQRE